MRYKKINHEFIISSESSSKFVLVVFFFHTSAYCAIKNKSKNSNSGEFESSSVIKRTVAVELKNPFSLAVGRPESAFN